MAGLLRSFFSSWPWKMAWRDSRSSRRRLLFFSISIVLGVAALTAIGGFGYNLQRAIDDQARTLLGADLLLGSRSPFTPEQERLFARLGGDQSRQISSSSMVYFPKGNGTRLVQVRGIRGDFPYYGRIETEPADAIDTFHRESGALVEESLLIQYQARIGDPIRIGQLTTKVVGTLLKVPGETVMFSTIAPRVYLTMDDLEKAELLGDGSLANYRVYFRFNEPIDVEALVKRLDPETDRLRLRVTTVEERKEDLGRSMANLYHFLSLAGFVALLLGAVGVASAIHVHIKQRINTVAVLHCLGARATQTFAVYLIQAGALGLFGATLGAGLGLFVQQFVPVVMADFLPFPLRSYFPWRAVLEAVGIGFLVCLLFALLPLLGVRRVSPLAAIRASFEAGHRRSDPMQWWLCGVIVAAIAGFALLHSQRWYEGLSFAGGLGAAFGLLFLVAKFLSLLARYAAPHLPYVWRQGLANLHRPQNRTTLMILSLGLGTFVILTLYLVKDTLLTQLVSSRDDRKANLVLFDIQSDQQAEIAALVRQQGFTILDQAPVVTMRLDAIKGRRVEDLLTNRTNGIPGWALRREYRSSYGATLRSGEKIVAGQWPPAKLSPAGVVPISLEEGIAGELGVGLGDQLVFDVQGIPLQTVVASLREVDWRRVQPNFFVIFPPGVLEEAPTFHVLITRVEDAVQSASLQSAVVDRFPNVSAIDLTLILQTLDTILGKVAFAVRFMAAFTVGTGLLVLAGAILTGRFQRTQESVLLRVLGASSSQVLKILLAEYASLGSLAALSGILLSLAAAWALAKFLFSVPFAWPLLPLVIAFATVSGLTIIIGMLASRGVLKQPPLAILRSNG